MSSNVKFPILELLPEADRVAVISRLKMLKYAGGEIVYERGGPCRDVFFIFDGRIRIDTHAAQGDMAFFHSRGPGEMVGFYSAITEAPQPVTATAMEQSRLGRMAGPEFTGMILSNRAQSAFMLRLLAGMLVSETKRIAHLITLDALQRAAAEILERAVGGIAEIPPRVELASRLGMTRETLAKQLSELRRRGLIRIEDDKIEILDAKQLADLVG
jgi:CRP-like cAMP-binding protein